MGVMFFFFWGGAFKQADYLVLFVYLFLRDIVFICFRNMSTGLN